MGVDPVYNKGGYPQVVFATGYPQAYGPGSAGVVHRVYSTGKAPGKGRICPKLVESIFKQYVGWF